MKRTESGRAGALLAILLAVSLLGGCSERKAPAPTPAATPAATPAPTPSPSPVPVAVCGRSVAWDTAELDLTGADGTAAELLAALPALPALERVDISDWALSVEEQLSLAEARPEILFVWTVDLFGVQASSEDEEISLDEVSVPVEELPELERLLPLLHECRRLRLCHGYQNGVLGGDYYGDDLMYEMGQRHPEIRFVYIGRIGRVYVPTDITGFNANNFNVLPKAADVSYEVQLKNFPDIVAFDCGHGGGNIADLSWLRFLPNLQVLILTRCCPADITPIGELKDLEYLEIAHDLQLRDISPLARCTKLRDLNLADTAISDLTPLLGLQNLRRCWISACPYLDQEQIEELKAALPGCTVDDKSGSDLGAGWREDLRYFWMRDMLDSFYMSDITLEEARERAAAAMEDPS